AACRTRCARSTSSPPGWRSSGPAPRTRHTTARAAGPRAAGCGRPERPR
ncbi:MAG: hypothetical protein AVDCRST_MAG38-1163, partial [uncultured Solirubrobacteraceae bacterium]